jgi:hypothetical protein
MQARLFLSERDSDPEFPLGFDPKGGAEHIDRSFVS